MGVTVSPDSWGQINSHSAMVLNSIFWLTPGMYENTSCYGINHLGTAQMLMPIMDMSTCSDLILEGDSVFWWKK